MARITEEEIRENLVTVELNEATGAYEVILWFSDGSNRITFYTSYHKPESDVKASEITTWLLDMGRNIF